MNSFKFFLRTFFGFSAREVNGFLMMAILMVLFLAIPPSMDLLKAHPSDHLIKLSSSTLSSRHDTLFAFNPNAASREQLLALGFSELLADRLIKFRNAKGEFRKKTDLLKLYGMDSSLYQKLEDSILIVNNGYEKKNLWSKSSTSEKKHPAFQKLNINECDSSELEKLRGIGPTLASRIIKYRQKLGGYLDTSQYKEVYGLKEFALEELKRCTFIASNFSPAFLHINSCTLEELGKHPYIGWKAAKILVQYRIHHGPYTSMSDILNSKALNEEGIKKVSPYVSWKEKVAEK
jgi:competence ComEA-like helix-hairpin-helix protein